MKIKCCSGYGGSLNIAAQGDSLNLTTWGEYGESMDILLTEQTEKELRDYLNKRKAVNPKNYGYMELLNAERDNVSGKYVLVDLSCLTKSEYKL